MAWKRNLLNKVGRVCLAKSVLAPLPMYMMQSLWFPKEICYKLESCIRNFIWGNEDEGRSWNLVSWRMITKPKKFGGLGVREAQLINISLLGKLA